MAKEMLYNKLIVSDSLFTVNNYTLQMPKYSDWQVEIFPGTHVKVLDKKLPSRFQRWMQELILGFKWRKV